jgi:hypothetical protein
MGGRPPLCTLEAISDPIVWQEERSARSRATSSTLTEEGGRTPSETVEGLRTRRMKCVEEGSEATS